jgi:uncharacterized protein YndB with AHSA1/START domain
VATTQTPVLEREIRIEARPETVFEFFTDPEKMVRWKGRKAWLEPQPGGLYKVEINDQVIAQGEYRELDSPRRLVFTWGWVGDYANVPPGSSTVEVELTPDGDGTIVRLTHRDLPPAAVEAHQQGWDLYLPRLAEAAAARDPGPDPNDR